MSEIIKDHLELAKKIEGKGVLIFNSLGKDTAAIIEWCYNFAKPKTIKAVHFEFISKHPDDELYLEWQKKTYPKIEFLKSPNPNELSDIAMKIYQTPTDIMENINSFEYYEFSMRLVGNEILKEHGLDYICKGQSKYESMSRASSFHKKGILQGNEIYPIGMFKKEEVINIIKQNNIKLHPCYKFAQGTFDWPSYYKMRSAFIANPEYEQNVLDAYPMLLLDKYRYEVLFKRRK